MKVCEDNKGLSKLGEFVIEGRFVKISATILMIISPASEAALSD